MATHLSSRAGRLAERGVAAMEFALIAPVMAIILFGALDVGRAYIAWQEVNYTAEAIVQVAEKLSALSTNTTIPSLTQTQMQAAMSSIYAQMPGLDYGKADGWLGKGGFAVTLSDVVFLTSNGTAAPCTTTTNCPTQTPYTYWSSYLQEGGPALNQPPATPSAQLLRACYTELTPVSAFPNDATQLTVMPSPDLATGVASTNTSLVLTPQLVADVSFTFYPFFAVFLPSAGITFRASAVLPTPVGGLAQPVYFILSGNGNVTPCPNVEQFFANQPPS
jgi:Flp pilus assembly protein TadG